MEKIYKPKDISQILGVTVNTLQRWDREGKFPACRNAANRRYYTQEQLNRFLGKKNIRKVVAYTRVSSRNQQDEHIEETGSGLNYKRKKWNKLLQEVEDREIDRIYVTYKDRFVRFGFDWFNDFCERHGTKIVVLNNPKTSPDQELVNDLISIIHDFSCRIYGLRKYSKAIRQHEKELERK